MTVAEGRELVGRRKAWLKKKGLTARDVADKTGLQVNSAFRWFSGPRKLHQLYAERVISAFPDFPLR